MDLHTPNQNPDWVLTSSNKATLWQRMALATRGIVTPGNVLSLLGLALFTWGAWRLYTGDWQFGLCLMVVGRLADIADGLVAELTKTKSRLGEAVDVVCDKLATAILVVVAAAAHLVPLWFLAVFTAYNMYLALFGALQGHRYRLHANQFAKLAAVAGWVAIGCLLLQAHVSSPVITIASTLLVGVYGLLAGLALYTYHQDLHKAAQARLAAVQWPSEITDVVCVANSHATNYQRAHRLLAALSKQLQLEATIFTFAKHELLLQKFLKQHAHGHTLLITIAGGDGSVSAVTNTLQRLQAKYPDNRYYVLPLWGGNANDLAYMLNGLPLTMTAKRLVTESAAVSIPFIGMRLQRPNEPVQNVSACCYASFGASAYATRQLDQHRFSTNKVMRWLPPFLILRELLFVSKAALEAPLHLVEIENKEKAFYEHTLINGSRIAKVNRIPVTLSQPEFFHALVTRKEPSLIISLIRVILGKPDTRFATHTHLEFTTKTPVDAQIDGEALQLPSHTHITAKIIQTPLRFISTKLRANP